MQWIKLELIFIILSYYFSVKTKFSHAYTQEYPYRINNVLECEFYLLEMMVSIDIFFYYYNWHL